MRTRITFSAWAVFPATTSYTAHTEPLRKFRSILANNWIYQTMQTRVHRPWRYGARKLRRHSPNKTIADRSVRPPGNWRLYGMNVLVQSLHLPNAMINSSCTSCSSVRTEFMTSSGSGSGWRARRRSIEAGCVRWDSILKKRKGKGTFRMDGVRNVEGNTRNPKLSATKMTSKYSAFYTPVFYRGINAFTQSRTVPSKPAKFRNIDPRYHLIIKSRSEEGPSGIVFWIPELSYLNPPLFPAIQWLPRDLVFALVARSKEFSIQSLKSSRARTAWPGEGVNAN